ncbi:WLM domain-containing protein [Colletotrichum scovillei]|uniref:WLM domain-containing protein n=1 Tax=Colletotrichum scovillei TaxID=1209932 RepID=A0A9P7R191_9PEZI|nr:WLM domain-containing protein [Colletotrichum scovillei]KAG7049644.1 WLM domain-containing protein [Colletotrichum scovillei]
MPEHDALILSFSHLPDFPRAPDALQTLKKVASLVKPIMRVRGWKVRELAEFYPDQANLLGLNINRGQRILVRLRYPNDRSLFLPIEHVVDTMLHELSHIVFGPHDGNFHALWNQLRDEHESLIRKGYTGEGFLSDGHRLGGGRIPMHEARRLARASAEKRRTLTKGSGQRLGGSGPSIGSDIRRTIVGAIERRNTTLQGCGNTNHNDREIQQISETATKNGFRTQAEEDAANEAAIAQALWELVQEEERQRYGGYFIPPTAQNPTGNGGGSVMGDNENMFLRRSQGQERDLHRYQGSQGQRLGHQLCLHRCPNQLRNGAGHAESVPSIILQAFCAAMRAAQNEVRILSVKCGHQMLKSANANANANGHQWPQRRRARHSLPLSISRVVRPEPVAVRSLVAAINAPSQ